jgi:hypothetical protein
MPVQFQPVRPGDLITAELFNALLGRLAEIEDLIGGTGGLVEVPRLVGLTLGQAQSQLAQSGSNFLVDEAYDTLGISINPNTNEARARRVLNQVPPPGARVASAGPIDVILSASGTTTPPTTPAPSITSISPRPVELGAELTLSGINFGSPPGLLTITIDGEPVQPSLHQPQTIRFVVPDELPNVPTGGRDSTVVITTDGGQASTNSLATGARPRLIPTSGTLPRVTGMLNASGASIPLDGSGQITIGQNVTINGQNFLPSAGQNQLVITTQSGAMFRPVSTATANQITFNLGPLPGHSQANRFIQATLAVQAGESAASRSVAIEFLFVLPLS